MTAYTSLLIELGTEELPVRALPDLADAFFTGVLEGLRARGIAFEKNVGEKNARVFYTPRRLAVFLPHVATEQPAQHNERRGPALTAGLDSNGNPTKALLGFAASCGVSVEALEKLETDKGAWFVYRSVKPGAPTAQLLPAIVSEVLEKMPVPKPMRWGSHDYAFARPVHWLVMLLGDTIVDGTVLGASADRMSRGHRFHHPKPVWIARPEDYLDALRAAQVLADPDARREQIRRQVDAAAAAAGGMARIEPGILEEVNCLTEWPVAIACGFERDFLAVPQEALISTMETHQKFFPVLDRDGRLTEHFIAVANIESRRPDEVRKGFERVIRPRFADAKFFFEEDRKKPLADYFDSLAGVTYQQKLGSLADKSFRVAALARALAGKAGVDPDIADHAAKRAKCDLMTRMVNEFPELQGTMGRYYALASGEPPEVAAAIEESYLPRFAGDAIAPTRLGQVLALAERLDTLAGGFVAGLKPTGNKDPFSLRRNALGLARTVVETPLELDLVQAITEADKAIRNTLSAIESAKAEQSNRSGGVGNPSVKNMRQKTFAGCVYSVTETTEQLYAFILDRLRGYYADQGVPGTQFDAVAALEPASLLDFDFRLKAVGEFVKLPEADALAAANKRIRNILRKAEEAIPNSIDPSFLQTGAEADLAQAIERAIAETDIHLHKRDYVAVLLRLAALRAPVDGFFDHVMVMDENPALRRNRLALLKRLSDRFLAVADISLLAVG